MATKEAQLADRLLEIVKPHTIRLGKLEDAVEKISESILHLRDLMNVLSDQVDVIHEKVERLEGVEMSSELKSIRNVEKGEQHIGFGSNR